MSFLQSVPGLHNFIHLEPVPDWIEPLKARFLVLHDDKKCSSKCIFPSVFFDRDIQAPQTSEHDRLVALRPSSPHYEWRIFFNKQTKKIWTRRWYNWRYYGILKCNILNSKQCFLNIPVGVLKFSAQTCQKIKSSLQYTLSPPAHKSSEP